MGLFFFSHGFWAPPDHAKGFLLAPCSGFKPRSAMCKARALPPVLFIALTLVQWEFPLILCFYFLHKNGQ